MPGTRQCVLDKCSEELIHHYAETREMSLWIVLKEGILEHSEWQSHDLF